MQEFTAGTFEGDNLLFLQHHTYTVHYNMLHPTDPTKLPYINFTHSI